MHAERAQNSSGWVVASVAAIAPPADKPATKTRLRVEPVALDQD